MVEISKFASEARRYIIAYIMDRDPKEIEAVQEDIMIPNKIAQMFSPVDLNLPDYRYTCHCIADCNTYILEEITEDGKIIEAIRYEVFNRIVLKFDKVYKNNIYVLRKDNKIFVGSELKFTLAKTGVPIEIDGNKFKASRIFAYGDGMIYYSRRMSIAGYDVNYVRSIAEFLETDRAIAPTKDGKLSKPKSDKFVISNYLYEYKKKQRLKYSQSVAILDDSKVLYMGEQFGSPISFIEDLVDIQGKYVITKERVFGASRIYKEVARYKPGDVPIKIKIDDQIIKLNISSFYGYYSDYIDEPILVEINGKPAKGTPYTIEQILNLYPEADEYIIPEHYQHIFALKDGVVVGLVDIPAKVVGKPRFDNLFIIKIGPNDSRTILHFDSKGFLKSVKNLPLSVLRRLGYIEIEDDF